MSRQRACDAILAATVLGALLLLPPIVAFFERSIAVLGMPLIVVYVFGVWLALIGTAWTLSGRLPVDSARASPPQPAARDNSPGGRAD